MKSNHHRKSMAAERIALLRLFGFHNVGSPKPKNDSASKGERLDGQLEPRTRVAGEHQEEADLQYLRLHGLYLARRGRRGEPAQDE
jgi:hypothetical protein